MKLMITQTIRITEAMESELSRLAEELGESKQTVIRLAIKEGLGIVARKFGAQEARPAEIRRKFSTNNER